MIGVIRLFIKSNVLPTQIDIGNLSNFKDIYEIKEESLFKLIISKINFVEKLENHAIS